MSLAPIIVFAYNRPNHLRRTLDALARNEMANESVLYIFCDGAKPQATEEQCARVEEVREVAEAYQKSIPSAFARIEVVKADKNKGLANSIIDGVTEVIGRYGKVIVVEDDLLTSPYFLRYMNRALDYYQSFPAVMSISANRPPLSKMHIPDDYEYDVFVSLRNYSTGWATWQDRWERVDWSMDAYNEAKTHLFQAYQRQGDDVPPMMEMQIRGQIDSWAVRFGFAHFKEHSVAILPCHSYVSNIGFDGSGTHVGVIEDVYTNDLSQAAAEPRFLPVIYEDSRIVNAFFNAFTYAKRPWWQKGINYVCRLLGKPARFVIKKKVYE